jgi:8-oxo-dGTP pyrophosphatase MutT (NUDIX family)
MYDRLQMKLEDDPGVVPRALAQAAVLIALDDSGREPAVVLTQRAAHLRLHAGEVAFPGGKCDASDSDHWATALREAEEEVALPPSLVARLGVMPPLVTRTKIEVTPCVGRLTGPVELTPNRDELDAVFKVPLSFFAQAGELHFDRFDYGGRERLVPRYEWREYSIWGITAALLVQLVNLALDAGLDLEGYWEGR